MIHTYLPTSSFRRFFFFQKLSIYYWKIRKIVTQLHFKYTLEKNFSWSWRGGQFKKAIKGQIDIIKTRLFNSILISVSKIFFNVIVWTNVLFHDFLSWRGKKNRENCTEIFFLHASQSLSYTSQFFPQILWKSILHIFFISFKKRYFDSKILIVGFFFMKKHHHKTTFFIKISLYRK